VNGNMFAGLFEPFDPMGDGRKSDKIMLPKKFMKDVPELRKWIKKAFEEEKEMI